VVKPLRAALGDTPALLLSGGSTDGGTLQEEFIISELEGARDGLHWVQLLPKATESSYQEMRLGFGEKHIRKMELVDGFGQRTELLFSNVEVNVKLPQDSFVFVPPTGVDVIGDTGTDNEQGK
jgi:outer membrane lipoprotein carrier protein